jgi:hypothetical protein
MVVSPPSSCEGKWTFFGAQVGEVGTDWARWCEEVSVGEPGFDEEDFRDDFRGRCGAEVVRGIGGRTLVVLLTGEGAVRGNGTGAVSNELLGFVFSRSGGGTLGMWSSESLSESSGEELSWSARKWKTGVWEGRRRGRDAATGAKAPGPFSSV